MVAQWSTRLGLDVSLEGLGRWVARLVAVVLAAIVLLSAGAGVVGPGVVSRSGGGGAAGLARLESLPLQAQSVISTAVGAGAPGFAAQRFGGGYRLRAPGVSARFAQRGVVVRAGAAALSFSSLAVGRGAHLDRLGGLSVTERGGRVVYERGGLSEWYAAGPLGIEQGFTLQHRPAGAGGPLRFEFGVGGSVRAQQTPSGVRFVTRSGRVALRYGGLSATDARGRALPVTLTVDHGRLLLGVSDAGARYPVRIDPLIQQGPKLTGSAEPGAVFGLSVALSSDGNTALIGGGGIEGNSATGAAWVFTRSGSTWTQQGPALTPNDETRYGTFGYSVALSSDGNTALIGGIFDNEIVSNGAAWVFTRSGSTWTQQGPKLTANDGNQSGDFGYSVALSSDGNTALIGGQTGLGGAAWVFTRSGSTWTQQGSKLTAVGQRVSFFSLSVALSSDGNTALVALNGGAFVFTRSGGAWTQQGSELTGPTESPRAAVHVALSSDGDTALVDAQSGGVGAVWLFTRSGSTWTRQGSKLTENQDPYFGLSVALSSDGDTALIGDPQFPGIGRAWVFARSGGIWTQEGSTLTGDLVALSSDGNTALIGGGRVVRVFAASAASAAQIKSSLLHQIRPHGKTAKIAALLKNRGYGLSFTALSAGRVVIDWYYLPKGAHRGAAKPNPVLVAVGKAAFTSAQTLNITIKLTASGKRLLKHSKRLTLTAQGTFTPTAKHAIVTTNKFTLAR